MEKMDFAAMMKKQMSETKLKAWISSKRKKLRKKLDADVAEWMLEACKNKGWDAYARQVNEAVDRMDKGEQPRFARTIYVNKILSRHPNDKEAFLRYDRFVDGFRAEYKGSPAFAPRY